MKKRLIVILLVVFLFLLGCFTGWFICIRSYLTKSADSVLGEQAVKLLYDYGTVEQLDYQMRGLKEITTEPVFNQLTIDNEERTLNTYLKFNNESVSVNILKSTDSYVLYSLDTKSITSSRLFIFLFHVNDKGLIDDVREVEAVDFVKTID